MEKKTISLIENFKHLKFCWPFLWQVSLRRRSTSRSFIVEHCTIKNQIDIIVNFVVQYIIQIIRTEKNLKDANRFI
ncbi:hypothetical protein BpHYR1_034102 [Brachionus plicatilis]|uniref:Uncharacterized protein n=1 Tax=Brachionus plicatilis TaxID=10195 RepID=A0A3M7PJZ2_BRAPC|nr:hypothetical protein BpHYR1_034102 [Brachionus plicatilis]